MKKSTAAIVCALCLIIGFAAGNILRPVQEESVATESIMAVVDVTSPPTESQTAETELQTESPTTVEKQTAAERQTSNAIERTTVVQETASSALHDYVANKNTKKFHYSTCSSVGQMKDKNKVYYNNTTRDKLISDGYVPCQRCNP